jgi:hypothetical protein
MFFNGRIVAYWGASMIRKYGTSALVLLVVGGGAVFGAVSSATAAVPSAPSRVAQAQPYPPTPPPTFILTAPFLSLTEPTLGTIVLNWTPSTSSLGLAGYDIYASSSPFKLIATVGPDTTTYVDHRSWREKVSYYVEARDIAGNTARSNIVTRFPKRPKGGEFKQVSDHDAHGHEHGHGHDQDHGRGEEGAISIEAVHGDHDGHGHHGDHAEAQSPGAGPEVVTKPEAVAKGAPAAKEGGLPYTGAPLAALAGTAGALLILGFVATRAVRRRSADDKS